MMFRKVSMFSAAVVCAAPLVRPAVADSDPFTIVAIPDTQVQSINAVHGQSFLDQTTWIRDNAAAKNIAFATHLGDLVQGEFGGIEQLPGLTWGEQWDRADEAMQQLDLAHTADGRTLPYSASIGNHDLLNRGNKANVEDDIPGGGFVDHFGPSRYAPYQIGGANSHQWYGGADATGWNHYQIFEAGGHEYLHINLEYKADDPTTDVDSGINRNAGVNDAINWAQSILDAHPDLPTIISTHQYLTDIETVPNGLTGYHGDGVDNTFGGQRMSTGQEVWNRLVKPNSQVFMTLNGHDHEGPYREDGEHHQISINDAGLPVMEVLVNYQDYFNPLTGNDPYLRTIEFDPAAGEIRHETFSPTFALFNDDPDAVEDRLDAMLDAFDAGMPIVFFEGEEFVGEAFVSDPNIAAAFGLPASTRAEAEQAFFDFFGVADRAELRDFDFSAHLTDPDSQFTFGNLQFDANGRPVPEPATLALFAAGLLTLTRRGNKRP